MANGGLGRGGISRGLGNMLARVTCAFLVGFAVLTSAQAEQIAPTAPGTQADKATFTDLLARAEAQAAAGHRWSPPGDNMTETVARMMDLISSATPKQLAELSALLESDRTRPSVVTVAPDVPAPRSVSPVSKPVLPVPPATPVPKAANLVPKPASPTAPHLDPRAAELFSRGEAAEQQGDVSGARRLYASAAERGDAAAALNLGRLYDPAYLKQKALGGIDPDPAQARHWYERAAAMGDVQAGPLLEALSTR